MFISAIIPAAGSGVRFGDKKQFKVINGHLPFLADDAELIEATPHRAILALLLNVLTSTAALAHAAGEIHGPEDYAEFVGLVTRHLIDAADPEFQAELRRVIDNNG